MFNPISTYRIQFHKDFTFDDLEKIIPYLAKLGIKTLYASPIFKAVPGSTHGYDNVDPLTINPEIGTLAQLKQISKKLKEKGISWLQDIVPNHMAFHSDNVWLMDLLEKGLLSLYRNYFDQSLADNTLFKGPIMVPFLGNDLDEVIEANELKIDWNQNGLVFKYGEQAWPLNLRSYHQVLQAAPEPADAIKQLLQQINEVNEMADAEAFALELNELKLQLSSLINNNKAFSQYLQACLENINSNKPQLQVLAGQQYYRLCNWQETDSNINFRRFFTVNSLICLNIQKEEVFNHVHELINSLLKEDIIQGLRIDHIDGLYDPTQYLQRLRALAGDDTYIIVEKILESGEELPQTWPIQGSTGYDFLAIVNNLFTNQKSEKAFTSFYKSLNVSDRSITQQIQDKKSLILTEHMNGELQNLTMLFIESVLSNDSVDRNQIKQAISQMLIDFPVYRFYGNAFPLSNQESGWLARVFKKIKKHHPDLLAATELLEKALLEKPQLGDEIYNDKALHFYQRCMQFTGPLMAKGVEDTLMYTYNRFIDHNEVGDSPEAFGMSVAKFHETMQKRQQQWPLAINATATHDTKRGEGVRARLNVLTSIPDEWLQTVTEWQQLNQDIKTNGAPDENDEYFIYQTLIGAYPMPGQDEEDFGVRLNEYLEKMLREAKRHSTWTEPNEVYEAGVKNFATALLDKTRPFWELFASFHQKVSDLGIINSLSQATLKLTCPGVPDIYQGCEHWDLSLVDPDNRRPVDYELRKELLTTANAPASLWENRFNGQIKLWLVNMLLHLRTKYPDVFNKADYIPLQVKGKHKENVIAFARVHKGVWIIVIVPIDTAAIYTGKPGSASTFDWGNTCIILPGNAPSNWKNTLTNAIGKQQKKIELKNILHEFPLAVLKLEHAKNGRNAGILMHITSLPSLFGIGDFGSQAKSFVDLLRRCHQQYWQILPLNPIGEADAYSPYSSHSSHAGNTLLISPELLAADGLLNEDDLKLAYVTETDRVDFKAVEQIKNHLFNKAWDNYNTYQDSIIRTQFDDFCEKEAFWVNDYALYSVLKQLNNNQPWHTWPDEFKFRDQKALSKFNKQHANELEKVKWLQYIFSKQWLALKAHCNQLDVKLFGDLPFYISYDSVDVWTNPEIFSLNENLELKSVCGVPPDYFNEDGQRWGMPVFKWDKLKATNYDWWMKRIRKNLEWYDLLRLDHFRAFAAYWEIPAEEKTAVNGKWITGPGSDFFNALKKEFGKLPFVAEDLGEIDEAVYNLREDFNLPGMKVLQFAFGDGMPQSAYAPHHHAEDYFVYTGTHDNNTTLGWYRKDADASVRKQLKKYTGVKITEKNINRVLIKAAFSSVCKTAIIPIQDWLNLDENSRMNTPAGNGENWTWRLTGEQLANIPEKKIRKWTLLYDRG
jgi:malto-oligosyltrehalose synthase/4-alpha-glucanotransferase